MELPPLAALLAVKYYREGHDVANITGLLERDMNMCFLVSEIRDYLVGAGFLKP